VIGPNLRAPAPTPPALPLNQMNRARSSSPLIASKGKVHQSHLRTTQARRAGSVFLPRQLGGQAIRQSDLDKEEHFQRSTRMKQPSQRPQGLMKQATGYSSSLAPDAGPQPCAYRGSAAWLGCSSSSFRPTQKGGLCVTSHRWLCGSAKPPGYPPQDTSWAGFVVFAPDKTKRDLNVARNAHQAT